MKKSSHLRKTVAYGVSFLQVLCPNVVYAYDLISLENIKYNNIPVCYDKALKGYHLRLSTSLSALSGEIYLTDWEHKTNIGVIKKDEKTKDLKISFINSKSNYLDFVNPSFSLSSLNLKIETDDTFKHPLILRGAEDQDVNLSYVSVLKNTLKLYGHHINLTHAFEGKNTSFLKVESQSFTHQGVKGGKVHLTTEDPFINTSPLWSERLQIQSSHVTNESFLFSKSNLLLKSQTFINQAHQFAGALKKLVLITQNELTNKGTLLSGDLTYIKASTLTDQGQHFTLGDENIEADTVQFLPSFAFKGGVLNVESKKYTNLHENTRIDSSHKVSFESEEFYEVKGHIASLENQELLSSFKEALAQKAIEESDLTIKTFSSSLPGVTFTSQKGYLNVLMNVNSKGSIGFKAPEILIHSPSNLKHGEGEDFETYLNAANKIILYSPYMGENITLIAPEKGTSFSSSSDTLKGKQLKTKGRYFHSEHGLNFDTLTCDEEEAVALLGTSDIKTSANLKGNQTVKVFNLNTPSLTASSGMYTLLQNVKAQKGIFYTPETFEIAGQNNIIDDLEVHARTIKYATGSQITANTLRQYAQGSIFSEDNTKILVQQKGIFQAQGNINFETLIGNENSFISLTSNQNISLKKIKAQEAHLEAKENISFLNLTHINQGQFNAKIIENKGKFLGDNLKFEAKERISNLEKAYFQKSYFKAPIIDILKPILSEKEGHFEMDTLRIQDAIISEGSLFFNFPTFFQHANHEKEAFFNNLSYLSSPFLNINISENMKFLSSSLASFASLNCYLNLSSLSLYVEKDQDIFNFIKQYESCYTKHIKTPLVHLVYPNNINLQHDFETFLPLKIECHSFTNTNPHKTFRARAHEGFRLHAGYFLNDGTFIADGPLSIYAPLYIHNSFGKISSGGALSLKADSYIFIGRAVMSERSHDKSRGNLFRFENKRSGAYLSSGGPLTIEGHTILNDFGEIISQEDLTLIGHQSITNCCGIMFSGGSMAFHSPCVEIKVNPPHGWAGHDSFLIGENRFWNFFRQFRTGPMPEVTASKDIHFQTPRLTVRGGKVTAFGRIYDQHTQERYHHAPGYFTLQNEDYWRYDRGKKGSGRNDYIVETDHTIFSSSTHIDLNFAHYFLQGAAISAHGLNFLGSTFQMGGRDVYSLQALPQREGIISLEESLQLIQGGAIQTSQNPNDPMYQVGFSHTPEFFKKQQKVVMTALESLFQTAAKDAELARPLMDFMTLSMTLSHTLTACTLKGYLWPENLSTHIQKLQENALEIVKRVAYNHGTDVAEQAYYALTRQHVEQSNMALLVYEVKNQNGQNVLVPYVNIPQNAVDQRLTHRGGAVVADTTHIATTQLTDVGYATVAGQQVNLTSKGDIRLSGSTLKANESLHIYGHNIQSDQAVYITRKGYRRNKAEIEIINKTALPLTLDAPHVQVVSESDVTLTAPHIISPFFKIIAPNGKVHFKAGVNEKDIYTTKTNKSVVWQRTSQTHDHFTTFTLPVIEGKVEVYSDQTILDEIKGKVNTYKDLITIEEGRVSYNPNKEVYNATRKVSQGPSVGLKALVAIGAALLTNGVGASLLNVAPSSFSGVMSSAAFSSVCSQSAVALLNQEGDPGKALKALAKTDTIKNIATATASAGIFKGVCTNFNIPTTPSTFDSHLTYNIAKAGINSTLNMAILGQKPEEAFETALKSIAAGTFGGILANKIGLSYQDHQIDAFTHKLLHGGVGAITGSILAGEKGAIAGALGAVTAEVVAEVLSPQKINYADFNSEEEFEAYLDSKINEFEKNSSSIPSLAKFTAATVALLTGQDVDIAYGASVNAVENNAVGTLLKPLAKPLAKLAYRAHQAARQTGIFKAIEELGISAYKSAEGLIYKYSGQTFSTLEEALTSLYKTVPSLKTALGQLADDMLAYSKTINPTISDLPEEFKKPQTLITPLPEENKFKVIYTPGLDLEDLPTLEGYEGAPEDLLKGQTETFPLADDLPDSRILTQKLWEVKRYDKVLSHPKFGKFYHDPKTDMWWSKDTAQHGGSAWKVFEKEGNLLKWKMDADVYGQKLVNKHKGDTGKTIPLKELSSKK